MPNESYSGAKHLIDEIDAHIAEEKRETDLVASMLAEINGVTYRLELHGSVGHLYVPIVPVEWSPVMTEPSPDAERFTGPYAFNEAAAFFMVHAMPKYEDETDVVATGLDDL